MTIQALRASPSVGSPKAQTTHTLAEALDAVEREFKREVVLPEAERVASVLWTAHTYVYKYFLMTPRLFITSDGPESGKSACSA